GPRGVPLDPRLDHSELDQRQSGMPMPTPAQRKRRQILSGLALIAGGIWFSYMALDSFHTGIQVPGNSRHNYPMEWWEVAAIAILLCFFGICMIVLKPKGER